ncbi:diiron oxygenase [Solihabitans fulvus]|uniref:Diiron oxygenase n=1 Tax=Solihabitans fulvus TaxID=1892852 RepID=A0A5B2WWN0_9PSEU|nr:diiron oxygenase [Solihabitans fulvus]KAA2255354.1 diiron oxygenase [Solihabitans fulvus]
MVSDLIEANERFRGILDRLSTKSIEDYYNPYRVFEWPETLPENMWWMSPDLTSTHGSEVVRDLGEEQLHRLSKYESVNFYSLNVHGIRELLIEVTRRIHTTDFEAPSEFFHHFIGEENEHMWFFAEFCSRYGHKIYKQPRGGNASVPASEAESLLVFARILIFEELVDYYNAKMAQDTGLHDTIRQVNRIHHQDESRHIAFGRELVAILFDDFRVGASEEELRNVERYLKRYVSYSFESLFNPQVYRDAGIEDPLEFRSTLLNSPTRHEFEQRVFRKPLSYLVKTGIFRDKNLHVA